MNFLDPFRARFYAILRITSGFAFLWHGTQKLFGEPRSEASETREQDDSVSTCSGDGDGIELQIAEAPDHRVSGVARAFAFAASACGEVGPLRLEQTGTGEGKSPGGSEV